MKKLIIIGLSVFTLVSCNKWLSIAPKGEVDANVLLTDLDGFNSALAGVYYTLSESSLYGKELSFGAMDVMAQYWNVSVPSSHIYRDVAKYDYVTGQGRTVVESIWKNFYYAISQCNLVLESLDRIKDRIDYSELIRSEALGLRAMCHMELFRFFGPVIKQESDLDKPAIFYRTDFRVNTGKFESGRAVLEKAIADLATALELAEDDPIKIYGRKGDAGASEIKYNDLIAYRGIRMNYFAVLGMLARAEQMLLNKEGAYLHAKRIIDELEEKPVLKFTTKANLDGQEPFRDYNYSSEMLFGLHNSELYKTTNPMFRMNDEYDEKGNGIPIDNNLYTTFLNSIYSPEGGGTDNRLRRWFELQKNGEYYDLTKLRKAVHGNRMEKPYEPELPVMRLSEVYYIACESQIGVDNDLALSYLNEVRVARNIQPLQNSPSDEALLSSLVRDMRKEFIGEGRMFPAYKRLYYPIYVRQGVTIEPNDKMFVFPIPDDEYEYSPNEKPNK